MKPSFGFYRGGLTQKRLSDPLVARSWPHLPFGKPPCRVGQVGEGVSPALDAGKRITRAIGAIKGNGQRGLRGEGNRVASRGRRRRVGQSRRRHEWPARGGGCRAKEVARVTALADIPGQCPLSRRLGPLYPQEQTFRGPRGTSGCDPQATFTPTEARVHV